MNKKACNSQEAEVRKGPWSMEEDLILINHIANHGEGVWNSLAKAAGLKRTGKSCRLRWLNYLRPGVRRGNITTDEELLIIELHAKWGNRWSKIAKHLPGRTDNEIKNYWRTKIQKQMRQGEGSSPSEHLMELQEQGSTSHMSYPLCDHTMPMGAQLPTTSYQGPAHIYPEPFGSHADSWPLDSTDTYWSMDDLWSMQLLD